MPMNSAAPRLCRFRSRGAVSRPSPLSTMKRIGCTVVSAVMSVEIGREQLTDTPSLTSAAARLRWAGAMKFTVPSWSSAPQRPQLLSESNILSTSPSVGTDVMGTSERSGGADIDERAVEGRGGSRRGAITGEDVGAPVRVLVAGIRREPRALLDRHAAGGDAIGHPCGQDRGAAVIEHAHGLAVHDPTRRGVGGVQPDVVAIGAREDGLVVVDGVRARA